MPEDTHGVERADRRATRGHRVVRVGCIAVALGSLSTIYWAGVWRVGSRGNVHASWVAQEFERLRPTQNSQDQKALAEAVQALRDRAAGHPFATALIDLEAARITSDAEERVLLLTAAYDRVQELRVEQLQARMQLLLALGELYAEMDETELARRHFRLAMVADVEEPPFYKSKLDKELRRLYCRAVSGAIGNSTIEDLHDLDVPPWASPGQLRFHPRKREALSAASRAAQERAVELVRSQLTKIHAGRPELRGAVAAILAAIDEEEL